ncbi:hypothetical protein RCH21_001855 [Arthrobacter sp. PL16]|uniref:hypothetical protein n=1 Tax=Arthrobacter sp. PL16 TaxID=3071720 RepID=UPI002E022877|nr:hypothetical protein [Arthrobacter sp. PL16]
MNTTPSDPSPDSSPPRELLAIFGRSNGYLLPEQTADDAIDGLEKSPGHHHHR